MITFETTAEFEAAVMEVLKNRLSVTVSHFWNNGVEVSLYDRGNGDAIANDGVENL